jgi:hypothetical protein
MNKNKYYHFLSAENAIEDLDMGQIKIATIKDINDPFELLPGLREHKEYEKRKPYYKIRKEISKKYGLISFSDNWEDPLLWGHYAKKHRGIAIRFEILKDKVLRINYVGKEKRPKFDLTDNPKRNEELFLKLFKIKYESWSYENESRILVKLEDCIRDPLKGNKPFLSFSGRLKVKEIVLGVKFDKQKYHRIDELANKLEAKVIVTRQNWGDYKISKDGRGFKKLLARCG